jgi:uncharacterized protein (DUF4415 family)
MNAKRTSKPARFTDVPYDPNDREAVLSFWDKKAIRHTGFEELRAKRGRPVKAPDECKEQIALRVDKDVLDWFRAQGPGWQTRMNAALKAYRDAAA